MFTINEDTKVRAIEVMKEKIRAHNENLIVSDVLLAEMFDAAVEEVKKQFGL